MINTFRVNCLPRPELQPRVQAADWAFQPEASSNSSWECKCSALNANDGLQLLWSDPFRPGCAPGDVMEASAGDGRNKFRQRGRRGDDVMEASGGDGRNKIRQRGGRGDDVMSASAGDGRNKIRQRGGRGDDMMSASAGDGRNKIRQHGGPGDDQIFYNASSGNDRGVLRGGKGLDAATIDVTGQNVTVVDSNGNVLHKSGRGGSRIEVSGIEDITLIECGKTVKLR